MPIAAFPEEGVGSLRNSDGKHWLRPWHEDDKKVVVMRASADGSPSHPMGACRPSADWTHEPGEAVPMQLSGSRLDFDLWQEFLMALVAKEPQVNYSLCCGLPILIFAISLALAAALDTLWVLVVGILVAVCLAGGVMLIMTKRYHRFRDEILHLFQKRFEERGVTLSIEWCADTSHKIHKFLVLQPHAECLTNLVRITVPGNAKPGDELKVKAADRDVVFAATVPRQARPGDVFYAASPGPIIQPVEGVVVPDV